MGQDESGDTKQVIDLFNVTLDPYKDLGLFNNYFKIHMGLK